MTTTPIRIAPTTLKFLADLDKHNDRDWFLAHKERYQAALENMRDFADALIERMNRHDRIETASGKASLQRIYNDQRFHKERPPYKARFGGGLARVKPALRGGYYFSIKPGASFIACGFFAPEAADLKRIRMDILYDHETWERLLKGKALRKHLVRLKGINSRPRRVAFRRTTQPSTCCGARSSCSAIPSRTRRFWHPVSRIP